MNEQNKHFFKWAAGVLVLAALIFPTDLNPFKQKNPNWQVIKEVLSGTVYCNDNELSNDGSFSIGYAPCVRLTNVVYDSELGDEYCYAADVEVGGYLGQNYEGITDWTSRGNEYYCVRWHGIYVDSDVSNPDDWKVDFTTNNPAEFVQ